MLGAIRLPGFEERGGESAAFHKKLTSNQRASPHEDARDHVLLCNRGIGRSRRQQAANQPISSLMKQKWIDDAGGFVGDCETLLRLFRSESTDAWERKIAAYYLAVYEEEQRVMRRRLIRFRRARIRARTRNVTVGSAAPGGTGLLRT